MSFCTNSETDDREMLHRVGCQDFDELFAHVPAELQCAPLAIADGMSELEMTRRLRGLADHNHQLVNFCGGGFYDHFIPAAVDALASRGEFYTAYTPYQPEVSQGTLQGIYEYQTDIVRLTEMDVANASLYDGGTALFEALMMAMRLTGRDRILVDAGVNPIYRSMLRCYTANLPCEIEEVDLAGGLADRRAFGQRLASDCAAVVLQNPNFFGSLDDFTDIVQAAHDVGALGIVSTYPIALGLVKTPGEMGADIVTGEGQSLGIPLSFGGPYLGFMATRAKHVRKMPGRVAGVTTDARGRRGFTLTLQAREQHIRREKATSNICTNQGLCALRAHIYLALMGREGLRETADICARNAAYAHERLTAIDGVESAFSTSFFNEFALALPRGATDVIRALIDRGFAAGFPVGRYYDGMDNVLLVACTENRTKEEIDTFAAVLEGAVQ